MLNDKEKIFINKKIQDGLNDYVVIANQLYKKENLTGRSKEAKIVRDYLIKTGLLISKKGSKNKINKKTELTEAQKEFIDQNIQSGISPQEVTELIFKDRFSKKDSVQKIKIFNTLEYKAVHKYIREKFPDKIIENESGIHVKYSSPRSIKTVLNKVNKWCGQNLNENKLSLSHQKYLEKLLSYLNSPRFIDIYDSYSDINDKSLYEAEFVRSIWDKPDLTIDEINLYINVCMDYINLRQIDEKKNKINKMFHESEEQGDLTIRLSDTLKTISEEYNQCARRIDQSVQKLNGERSKRVSQHQQKNASIINLVELFQDEKERKLMIKIADMQKKVVEEEADKLEKMSSWKARILGVSREEVL